MFVKVLIKFNINPGKNPGHIKIIIGFYYTKNIFNRIIPGNYIIMWIIGLDERYILQLKLVF